MSENDPVIAELFSNIFKIPGPINITVRNEESFVEEDALQPQEASGQGPPCAVLSR